MLLVKPPGFTDPDQILRPELRVLLFGRDKILDLVETEADRIYAACFCGLAEMRLRPNWSERYSRLQAESVRVLRIREAQRPEVGESLLDLTLVVVDLLGSSPGDAFWPESRMLRTLRIAADRRGGMEIMSRLSIL